MFSLFNFVQKRNPQERPSAESLLSHPFIVNSNSTNTFNPLARKVKKSKKEEKILEFIEVNQTERNFVPTTKPVASKPETKAVEPESNIKGVMIVQEIKTKQDGRKPKQGKSKTKKVLESSSREENVERAPIQTNSPTNIPGSHHLFATFEPLKPRTEQLTIVVLGTGGVGKTCISIRFANSHFVEYYDPNIENCYKKTVLIDDESSCIQIIDTASDGAEISPLIHQYLSRADGFLVVFDITSTYSFERAKMIFEKMLSQVVSLNRREGGAPPIILVGNKADLQERREVPFEDANKYSLEMRSTFLEISAKNSQHEVFELFATLVRQIRQLNDYKNVYKDKYKKYVNDPRCVLL